MKRSLPLAYKSAFVLCCFFFSNSLLLLAQGPFGMPQELLSSDSILHRPLTITEINQNFKGLMESTDTALTGAKKRADRWYNYTLPYLDIDDNGYLDNKVINEAMDGIFTSPLQCENPDLADWASDGPVEITNKAGKSRGGWVSAIYNHPLDLSILLAGTRTSGIMRSDDGGGDWVCVTDGLNFPVLGIRQILGDMDQTNNNRIYALTGTDHIAGSLIYSDDIGVSWYENTVNLPEFRHLSNHPTPDTHDDVIFAISRHQLYVSFDNAVTFQPVDMPTDFLDTDHKALFKVFVLDNSLYITSTYDYSPITQIFKADYTIDLVNETITTSWTSDFQNQFIDTSADQVATDVYFSNQAMGRHYMFIQNETVVISGGETEYEDAFNGIWKSTDQGLTYDYLPYLSGPYSGPNDVDQVVGDINNSKCELIASLNDPNVLYSGQVRQMKRWRDDATAANQGVQISNTNSIDGGHHDDYRSSHLINDGGKDRMVFGNDGGVGLVEDGLEVGAGIARLNGDLSINLIHSFDYHPGADRTLFAFQDHDMLYRNSDGSYSSNGFLHEGSFAMIRQDFPNYFVGQDGYTNARIEDFPGVSSGNLGIVNGSIYGAYLGAKQEHYRHYPDRFAAGLKAGEIAMNRGVNLSEAVGIDFFQNQGSSLDKNYNVGDIAICQHKPQFIYAVSNEENDLGLNSIVKSINDADPVGTDPAWINLSDNLVSYINWQNIPATKPIKDLTAWKRLSAIEVDPFDENLVYVAFNKVRTDWTNTPPNYVIVDEKLRVLRSTTGGDPDTDGVAFDDWSEGLPAFPVEHILAVESDNHLVFCATSVGVYYRTDNEVEWQCFSEGLPHVRITDMKYDYCNNVLYASTYGRGLYKTPVSIPLSSSSGMVITGTETWDTNNSIYTDVNVQDGATLTITATIRMGNTADLIIEPGGEVVLNGGTLTNACGGVWPGIDVRGNTNQTQTASNSGTLRTRNNATISNAWIAVDTWNGVNGGYTTLGGRLYCTETNFVNNRQDCSIKPYNLLGNHNQNYKAYFNRCNFILDDDYRLSGVYNAPTQRVSLWGAKGVQFNGCIFTNIQTVSQSSERERAIFSIDASFTMKGFCDALVPYGTPCPENDLIKSEIRGFNKGIEAAGAYSTLATPTIKETIFDANMVGVDLKETHFSTVVENEFIVGTHPYPTDAPDEDLAQFNSGILTLGLSDFVIEGNDFIGSSTNTDFTHGAVVQEGEGATVSLYRNKMTDLGSGAIGAGLNDDHLTKGGLGEYGLRFICNENSNNGTDMEVRGLGLDDDGYIDNIQSGLDDSFQASGNVLSATDAIASNFVHMDFQSDKVYHYMYEGSINSESPVSTEMNIVPSPPGFINTHNNTEQNTCPSNLVSGPVKYDFYTVKSDYYNLLFVHHQFIDDGNTDVALINVAQTWSSDAWTLRGQLVANSPNNSDTVLIAAIDKNILPHGMLLEVLLLNPDALLNGNVISHINCCMVNPLPEYMMDIVYASRNNQTARSILEANLGSLRHKMHLSHRLNLKEMLMDTLGVPNDTIVTWLKERTDVKGRYNLVSHFLGRGQYNLAQTALDSLEAQVNLKSKARTELAEMRKFVSFLQTVDGNGKTVAELDTVEINELKAIGAATNAGTAGTRSYNILCFFYDICPPPLSSPKSNQISDRRDKPSFEELLREQNKITISPNPADQYVQLAYDLLFSKEETVMNIYDQLGRRVTTYTIGINQQGVEILDTRKLVGGLYIVEIVQSGKQLSSEKFIVQH